MREKRRRKKDGWHLYAIDKCWKSQKGLVKIMKAECLKIHKIPAKKRSNQSFFREWSSFLIGIEHVAHYGEKHNHEYKGEAADLV